MLMPELQQDKVSVTSDLHRPCKQFLCVQFLEDENHLLIHQLKDLCHDGLKILDS